MELFSQSEQPHNQPLAHRMRPRKLDEYIGQDHIIGTGRLLRRAIQADQLSSLIFYGPPGTGKTTLARVIANTTKSRFITMNAVLSGVKELRIEIQSAKDRLNLHNKRTILFVDEVHRWNKSQQDALLPWVENGTVILIGATTENPYFEVNSALVSRSRIFQLKKLTPDDLLAIANQALQDNKRGYGKFSVSFETGALEHLVDIANGDARSLLNALQLAVETTPDNFPPSENSEIVISKQAAEESIQRKVVLYDKEGDYHFDVISAFIKSIRGSDPDATLYWLARMVRAGEDPRYIFRRMLISASEDVGLADPQALTVVESAAAAFDRIGLPEGRFHLTQAALYLATAEKSNSSLGFFDALKSVEQELDSEVPNHLKDSSRDKKGFGHGEGYLYPHAYKDHWVAQQYLPTALQGKVFYKPTGQGYEKKIQLQVVRNREAQLEASQTKSSSEILTFSPPDRNRDRWLQRLISGKGSRLAGIREQMFTFLDSQRHDRILVLGNSASFLLWEACRLVPEGGVYGIAPTKEQAEVINSYAVNFPKPERPILSVGRLEDRLFTFPQDLRFETIMGMDLFSRFQSRIQLISQLKQLTISNGSIILSETLPSRSTRLSSLVSHLDSEMSSTLAACEAVIYGDAENELVNWTPDDLLNALSSAGFSIKTHMIQSHREQRIISSEDIARWILNHYFPVLNSSHDIDIPLKNDQTPDMLIDQLESLLGGKSHPWESAVLVVHARAAE